MKDKNYFLQYQGAAEVMRISETKILERGELRSEQMSCSWFSLGTSANSGHWPEADNPGVAARVNGGRQAEEILWPHEAEEIKLKP